LRANSLPEIAPQLASLLRTDAIMIVAQDGIRWWYFQRHGGPFEAISSRASILKRDGIRVAER
jgi:hypothetical protein